MVGYDLLLGLLIPLLFDVLIVISRTALTGVKRLHEHVSDLTTSGHFPGARNERCIASSEIKSNQMIQISLRIYTLLFVLPYYRRHIMKIITIEKPKQTDKRSTEAV